MSPQPTATEQPPQLDPTPLYRPGDIADVAARHGLTADRAGREWHGVTPDGRTVLVSAGPLWSGGAARLAVGGADDVEDWDLNLGYATPVWALDALLAGLLGTAAVAA